MATSGATSRAMAAQVVAAVLRGQSLDVAIAELEPRVVEADRALLRMLCYGCLRHHWQLQRWIDKLVAKPLRNRDREVNALLAIGLYQMTATRIPDHAVVSETVEATRALGRPKLAGLVNACLRRFMREQMADDVADDDDLPACWNHPAWMIDQLQSDWPDDWQRILMANNERAPMWLRVNSLRISVAGYRARLSAAGIESEVLAGVPQALRLLQPVPVDVLPGFHDGDVSVQDAAAQVAAPWLLRERRDRVLDACAAPGGKTGHLLEIGGAELDVLAIDSDPGRAAAIGENLARLKLDATILPADASNPQGWWDQRPYDGILLDAPCSASGVIRRHPDIKLLRRYSDIAQLAALQGRLLKALWPLLRPGGTLLYATCSVFSAENDTVTRQFLADQGDAVENDVLPNNNIRDLMRRKACGYQVLPGTAGLDGFYYAVLRKKVS